MRTDPYMVRCSFGPGKNGQNVEKLKEIMNKEMDAYNNLYTESDITSLNESQNDVIMRVLPNVFRDMAYVILNKNHIYNANFIIFIFMDDKERTEIGLYLQQLVNLLFHIKEYSISEKNASTMQTAISELIRIHIIAVETAKQKIGYVDNLSNKNPNSDEKNGPGRKRYDCVKIHPLGEYIYCFSVDVFNSSRTVSFKTIINLEGDATEEETDARYIPRPITPPSSPLLPPLPSSPLILPLPEAVEQVALTYNNPPGDETVPEILQRIINEIEFDSLNFGTIRTRLESEIGFSITRLNADLEPLIMEMIQTKLSSRSTSSQEKKKRGRPRKEKNGSSDKKKGKKSGKDSNKRKKGKSNEDRRGNKKTNKNNNNNNGNGTGGNDDDDDDDDDTSDESDKRTRKYRKSK